MLGVAGAFPRHRNQRKQYGSQFGNDVEPPPNPSKAYGIWGKGVTMDSGFQNLLCQCFGDGDGYARFPQQ